MFILKYLTQKMSQDWNSYIMDNSKQCYEDSQLSVFNKYNQFKLI